jgi:hypothetical protein
MDETLKYRKELLATAGELKQLSVERQNMVRQYESDQKMFKQKYKESDQAADARKNTAEMNFRSNLIQNEEKVHQALARERTAREQLAKASHELDEHVRAVETRMYATTRPPVGRGYNLTEQDFRQAQKSIPPVAFFMAISAVVFVAIAASSDPQLPLWLTITQSLLGLTIPTVIGLRGQLLRQTQRPPC